VGSTARPQIAWLKLHLILAPSAKKYGDENFHNIIFLLSDLTLNISDDQSSRIRKDFYSVIVQTN